MSQWGKNKTVSGALFAPHVTTKTFEPGTPGSLIDDIFLMSDGGDQTQAERVLAELKEKYVGKPYSTWILSSVFEQTMTEHEENARTIISSALKRTCSAHLAMDLYLSQGNAGPILTDEECKAISVNYPYPWTDIRQWFRRN